MARASIALPFGGTLLLATVVDEFVAKQPKTKVRIVSEGASEMLRRLRAGNVDFLIGIVQEPTFAGLRTESLAQTPYEILARPGHPLLSKAGLTSTDLAAYEWIAAAKGSSRRNCFDLLAEGPAPRAPITASSLAIIQELLASSNRLTVMTTYEIKRESGTLIPLLFGPLEPSPAIGLDEA